MNLGHLFPRVLVILIILISCTQSSIFAETSGVTPTDTISKSLDDPSATIGKTMTSLQIKDSNLDQDRIQVRDIYEALLKTKDDKLTLVSNIVNWLLAGASVLIILVTGFFGWLNGKINKQKNEVNLLINSLNEKEKQLAENQEKIDSFLHSVQFSEKMEQMEESIDRIKSLVQRWEREEIERKIAAEKRRRENLIYSIGDRLQWFSVYNSMHERIDNQIDQKTFDKLKGFQNLSPEQKETWTNEELADLATRGSALIHKYKRSTDTLV